MPTPRHPHSETCRATLCPRTFDPDRCLWCKELEQMAAKPGATHTQTTDETTREQGWRLALGDGRH